MFDRLSEEFVQLRDTVRRFLKEVVEPHAQEIERSNEIPQVILDKAAQLGLFGLSIPEEYGGFGTSEIATCVALEALSHGPGGVTFFVAPSAPAVAIRFAGTREQRDQYLPDLASGRRYASFCLTEPGAGSDAAGIKTRAIRKGDGWIINGSKIWISRASKASVFLVSAVTDREMKSKDRITVFVLDKRKGVTVGPSDRQIGLRGSGSAEVNFQDVEVTEADVLGKVGQGFDGLKFILGRARLWATARAVGIISRSLNVSLEHAATREQFNKKIGEFQAVKLKLADMASDLYIARLLLYRAAHLYDMDQDAAQEAAIAKLFSTEAASRAADTAIQIHGALGVSQEFHVERLYRDARAYRILDGTSDIQRLMIASRVQRGIGEAMAPGGLI